MDKKRQKPSYSSRLLFRRKLVVTAVLLAIFLFLFAYNIAGMLFLNRLGTHLEKNLDARMLTAAHLSVKLIEGGLRDLYSAAENTLIRIVLAEIRLENDFEAAYLIDTDLNVIIDSRLDLEMSVSRGYLAEDSLAIRRALDGFSATSPLHTVAGSHFKNAYSTVYDLQGNTALLVLEANADFLEIIGFFKRGLVFGASASLVMLVCLIAFMIWATALFLRTEAQLQASQRLAAMGQMAATVAHEIRNPLGIIKSTADLLREKGSSGTEAGELFGYINDEVNRMNRLVNDFLSLSREPELRTAVCDLRDVVSDAVRSFTPESMDVSVRLPDRELLAECDADMIHQVALNVMLNAEQALEGEEGRLHITLTAVRLRGKPHARLVIEDNGIGLPAEPGRIFDPFFTTKSSGTGLGLTVSRRIIERHGGQIEALSRSGRGTTIRIHLPLR